VTRPADVELVEKVLRESGADPQVQAQGWSGYPVAVIERGLEALGGMHAPRALRSLPGVLGPAAAVVVGVVLVVLLLLFARFLYRRWRARRRAEAAAPVATAALHAPVRRDASAWRVEVERRLAAGDVTAALEALWWWFASRVTEGDVDPSWTSRELLARCDRPDLAPLGHALDRLLYGARRPDGAEVRLFLRRGEEALA
jgi:hypothetical protein